MSDSEIIAPKPESVSDLPSEQERATKTQTTKVSSPEIVTPLKVAFWQRIFSFPAMLGCVLVGAVATIAQAFFVDPDVWWHIKQGLDIFATHHVPTRDIYSLTLAGRPWISFEWLGEVLLAAMYRLGGMRGLEALMLILGGAIVVALYVLAAIRSGNSKAAFLATAAVFVLATVSFNLRPQMLGYLFLILTLIVLERFRQGKRRAIWTLPILMVIWVNTHGSWIIGLGIVGVYLGSGLIEFHIGDIEARRWRSSDRLRLAAVLFLCACATIITPYGARLVKVPFEFAFSLPVSVANIVEFQPIPFDQAAGKVFLAFLLGVIALQVIHRFTWRLEELALFLFATVMTCLHTRFLLIFVPILTPLLATILARWVPRYERNKDHHVLNAVFMAVILGIVVRYFPSQTELWRKVAKTYPVAAVEYLNHHSVPGPMYNTYAFGGYLILSRGPEHRVFMDGRSELSEPGGVLADYLESADIKPGVLSILRKYGFQSCLLEPGEPLTTMLAALPDWQKVYEDETSVLFVRRNGSPVAGGRIAAQALDGGHGF